MNNIQMLDCTLRDGGYCNEWNFGYENIKTILNQLAKANIEIIECGFLTNKITYQSNCSKFTNLSQLEDLIPSEKNNTEYVVMMNYGEYAISDLPEANATKIDGIRIAFHKKDRYDALRVCEEVKNKGYHVYVQAMVSLNYTDEEFLEMIHKVNAISPHAFYIVDSFGSMKKDDVVRLFYLVSNNLSPQILIGFHSHNNIQSAYANAQTLAEISNRNLIIDASVYGMGRGAGNLNTELFVEYLNLHQNGKYDLKPLLVMIDDILNSFYKKNYWGYSLPNYISAKHNAHPNYASFLSDKNTLTFKDIDNLFSMIPDEKKVEFDKAYIEQLYTSYLSRHVVNSEHLEQFNSLIQGKDILLIAPGLSSAAEKEKIAEFIQLKKCIAISINFAYQYIEPDFIFVSNIRRFRKIHDKKKCIITSNIQSTDVYMQIDYNALLNQEDFVKDNAGLMAIKFLLNKNIGTIYLAGFDGYTYSSSENYMNQSMELVMKKMICDSINQGMTQVLAEYQNSKKIIFLTKERNIHLK